MQIGETFVAVDHMNTRRKALLLSALGPLTGFALFTSFLLLLSPIQFGISGFGHH
jgi:hypothetical protein